MATFRINAISGKPGQPTVRKDKTSGKVLSVKFLGTLLDADDKVIPPFANGVQSKAFELWLDMQDIAINQMGETVEISPAKMAITHLETIAKQKEAQEPVQQLVMHFTLSNLKQADPYTNEVTGLTSQSITVNFDKSASRRFELVDGPVNVGWAI